MKANDNLEVATSYTSSYAFSRSYFWFLVIAAVAIGLRIWNIDGQSVTNDEYYDLSVARDDANLDEMIRGARRFPPVYHLLLRAWSSVSSVLATDLGARYLSVIIGLVTVIAVWRLGIRLAGPKAGIAASLLTALSPFFIWYSQETRAYSLFLALSAVALAVFFRARETDRRGDWGWFAIICVAGMYTHYYFAFLIMTLAMLLLGERPNRKTLLLLMQLFGVMAIMLLPLLWIFAKDIEGQWGFARLTPFGIGGFGYTYIVFFTGYTLGPSLRDLHTMSMMDALRASLPWLTLLAVPLVILCRSGFYVVRDNRVRLYLIVLAVLPVLLVGLLSEIGPFGYNVRHVLWASIPLMVWMGAGLSRWPSRGVVFAFLSLCLLWGIALYNRNFIDDYRNEDTRAASAYLLSHAEHGATVFVISGYMQGTLHHYLGEFARVFPLPNISRQGKGLVDAMTLIERETQPKDIYWFLQSRTFHGDPYNYLLKELMSRGEIQHIASYAGFEIYKGMRD